VPVSTPDDQRRTARDPAAWNIAPWELDLPELIDLRDDAREPVPVDATSWQVSWPLPDAPWSDRGSDRVSDLGSDRAGERPAPAAADPLHDPLTHAYDPIPSSALPPAWDDVAASSAMAAPPASPSYDTSDGYDAASVTAHSRSDFEPLRPSLLDFGSPVDTTFDDDPTDERQYSWSPAPAADTFVDSRPLFRTEPPASPQPQPQAQPQPQPYDAGSHAYEPEGDGADTWGVPLVAKRITSDDLTMRRAHPEQQAPTVSGWRRLVQMIAGTDETDEVDDEDVERRDLIARVQAPLPDGHRLAVVSLKGGVGKTTATAVLGATLADLRIDRVVAIDANPDRGTLADKVERTTTATVRDLISDRGSIGRYATLQRYVNRTPSRLDVLASEADPAASHGFDEADYAAALDMLERFYNLILTDCGTGLLHAATRAALRNADSVVVVSSASLDGARSASATLDWLEAHGREDLAHNAVAIVNEVRSGIEEVDVRQIEEHFAARTRAVERVPYDPHLAAGAVIHIDQLSTATRDAYTRIAAAVVAGAAASAASGPSAI